MPFPPNIVLAATLTIQFGGLTNSEIQESILIHEMLHYMGIAGPDSAGQMNVLGNGQVVYGSTGISLAVREHCFK